MKVFRYLYRVIRWWLKCLWWGRMLPKPRREVRLYSRSFIRKKYLALLREEDRSFSYTGNRFSYRRRLLMARRRMEIIPGGEV